MKLRKKTVKTPNGRKANFRISPWFSPYAKTKGKIRQTLPFVTRSKCGVYLIRSKRTKEILYVGHSGHQLQKTLYRHFQSWKDKQYRATYSNKFAYEVMVILTPSCPLAYMAEQFYLHKIQPRDGIRKLEIPIDQIDFSYMPNPPKIQVEEVVPF